MPMPIRPIGDPGETTSPFAGIDLDALAAAAAAGLAGGIGKSSRMQVNAEANDEDADLLLDLWNNGRIVAEADSVEDKRYAVPEGFGNDRLMRLKAASLVHGDANVIRFTDKAVRVIKTLVLAEQNMFTKGAVRKPYSVILAENKAKAATRSTLAFERTAAALPVVEAQQNLPIDSRYMPQANTPYLDSHRIVKQEGTSDKQYIVRIFEVNGQYSVLAWNGRNGVGKHLAVQTKGSFTSRSRAQQVFDDLISSKMREGYGSAREISHPALLGEPPRSVSSVSSGEPSARPATRPAARPAVRPRDSVFDTFEGRRTEQPRPVAPAQPTPQPIVQQPPKPATKPAAKPTSVPANDGDKAWQDLMEKLDEMDDEVQF